MRDLEIPDLDSPIATHHLDSQSESIEEDYVEIDIVG